jgi:hypothetical protein
MGSVYEAVNPEIARRVAIKFLHRDLVNEQEAVARFFNGPEALYFRCRFAAAPRRGTSAEGAAMPGRFTRPDGRSRRVLAVRVWQGASLA